MNRVDFMDQLECLLGSISPAERDEALQYYNDYFDDAGKENEQEVIEALGNPARVAENIKRDLLGNGCGGDSASRVQASDRALVEYGKEPETEGKTDAESRYDWSSKTSSTGPERQGDMPYGQDAYEKPAEKAGMPPWAVALLVTLLIFASPVGLGLLAVAFGVVVCWYALILCVGVTAVALLAVLVVLVVTGILCCFVNPWAGLALVGVGLVSGGVGLIFLMLTVALAGIVTPAFWRGAARLFKRKRRRTAN